VFLSSSASQNFVSDVPRWLPIHLLINRYYQGLIDDAFKFRYLSGENSMFKKLLVVSLFLGLFAGSISYSSAQHIEELFPLVAPPTVQTNLMMDELPHLWFVELQSPPLAAGGRLIDTQRDKNNFRSAAADAGIPYQERLAFDNLWNGLSVQATSANAGKLAQLTSVKAVYPVEVVSIPENFDPGSGADLATALAMTGADIAQNDLGLSGQGIRVAVMDTGIDYDHPDLGGCFGPGCRVETGWDFVGNSFNANPASPAYDPVPVPGPDPDDCNGHGTHVAGIVGANAAGAGGVTGVAPEVTFGAYKVFGCAGSTTVDIMIAAMEMALDDGMDVLNMSIGSAFQWPQYPTAVAADNLVNQGMVVVASIGNNGASGVYSAGAPGLGEHVIGVASFDNSHVSLAAFTVSPDDTLIGYGTAAAAPLPPTEGSYPMARTGTTSTPDDACDPIVDDLTGYVVLIRRGTCPFHTKALNAQNANAAGVVLYNNVAGRFSPTVAGDPPIVIPVVAISDVEGALIDGRLQDGPVTMTWTEELLMTENPNGGLISSFSSYGLSPDLALKPDIGAPGGLIRSTYPLENGAYATISGTSMSSPHVAGAVALLLEAHPDTSAHAVRGIVQNSANPALWWGNPGLGFLDNVHRQGAGMLDIPGAVLSATSIAPAKLALGESEAGPTTHTLTVHNHGDSAVTYDMSFVNALSTGGSTFSPGFFLGNATVTFSSNSVTVPAGGNATVEATITPATGPNLGQYGGYLVFTDQSEGTVYRVPYAGFVGNYQEIIAMAPGSFDFPLLGQATSCFRIVDGACISGTYNVLPDGGTFDMSDVFNQPSFLIHLAHQVPYMEMTVHHAQNGRPIHPVFHKTNVVEFLPRNSTAGAFFAFHWDGTRLHSNGRKFDKNKEVPNGDYVVTVRVLKALGDAGNPDHWENWTSPVITIERP
jgi:minor extracellular serine protease Vpr